MGKTTRESRNQGEPLLYEKRAVLSKKLIGGKGVVCGIWGWGPCVLAAHWLSCGSPSLAGLLLGQVETFLLLFGKVIRTAPWHVSSSQVPLLITLNILVLIINLHNSQIISARGTLPSCWKCRTSDPTRCLGDHMCIASGPPVDSCACQSLGNTVFCHVMMTK